MNPVIETLLFAGVLVVAVRGAVQNRQLRNEQKKLQARIDFEQSRIPQNEIRDLESRIEAQRAAAEAQRITKERALQDVQTVRRRESELQEELQRYQGSRSDIESTLRQRLQRAEAERERVVCEQTVQNIESWLKCLVQHTSMGNPDGIMKAVTAIVTATTRVITVGRAEVGAEHELRRFLEAERVRLEGELQKQQPTPPPVVAELPAEEALSPLSRRFQSIKSEL